MYVSLSRVRALADLYLYEPLPSFRLGKYKPRKAVLDEMKRLRRCVFGPTRQKLMVQRAVVIEEDGGDYPDNGVDEELYQ